MMRKHLENDGKNSRGVTDIRENEAAVSEVIGTVMLISIVVIAVSIVGVVLLSQPPPEKIPALSASISNKSCMVMLSHEGGDMLENQTFRILVDSTDHTSDFHKRGAPGTWTSWGIGETLEYTSSPCPPMPERVTIVYTGGNGARVLSSAFFGASPVPTASVTSTPTATTTTPVPPPAADFTANPLTGPTPLSVSFTDTSTGSPTSWNWIFGDIGAGNTSTSQNPSHTYITAGTYSVNLTVSNTGGSNSIVKSNYITVSNPAPTVTSITPNTGVNTTIISITDLAGTNFLAGATVKLNRTGYADIAGTSVNVVSPTQITCTFDLTNKVAGQWNVVVTNSDGQSGILTNGFTITMPPAPTVTSITPNTGVNTTTISITNLAGNSFQTGATVKLNRTGYVDIAGTSVNVVSPTQITCTFDLTNKVAGQWNVAVTNSDGQFGILTNGFTITAPRGTIFYDGFETVRPSGNGWTETGSVDWGAYTPRNGANDVRLRQTEAITRTISTASNSQIVVQFAWAGQSLEAGEYVRAEYSTDGGSSWTTLSQINGVIGGAVPTFTNFVSPTLPASADNNANFRLRFRIQSSATNDYAYIDDVRVTGIPI